MSEYRVVEKKVDLWVDKEKKKDHGMDKEEKEDDNARKGARILSMLIGKIY